MPQSFTEQDAAYASSIGPWNKGGDTWLTGPDVTWTMLDGARFGTPLGSGLQNFEDAEE
jgi:hypothetical protein